MFAFHKSFGNRCRRKAAVPPSRRQQLALEQLEDRVVLSPIQAKYLALGGAQGFLGQALTGELATPYGGGRYEQFENGAIFWSAKTGAHDIYGPIASEFFATGNEKDPHGTVVEKMLGPPTRDETGVSGVAGARMNSFQGGNIYWSPSTGAHVVYGDIGTKYQALGGPVGYGLPTSDEANVPGVQGVRVQSFHD